MKRKFFKLAGQKQTTIDFSFSQLHICFDITSRIMNYVFYNLSGGLYVNSTGFHPFGFGTTVDGKEFAEKIGRQSKFFKGHKNTKFSVDSCYFGSKYQNPVSFFFYNKN